MGRRLQPRRNVHHRPGHEHLAAGVAPHRRLPGFDSDTNLERLGEPGRLAQASGASANGQPRTYCTQGVVLVDGRQPEDRHHRVAYELLGVAPEGQQLLGRRSEELAENLASSLGVEPAAQTSRVDDVGEKDRNHLAFLGADEWSHRGSAVRAEPSTVGERTPADRARHDHPSRICCTP